MMPCKPTLPLLALLLAAGCSSDRSYLLPPYEPVMAVNCFLAPGRPWEAYVHQTAAPGFLPLSLPGASVLIEEAGGASFALAPAGDSLFTRADSLPKPGACYQLSASFPGLPPAGAEACVPSLPAAAGIEITDNVGLEPLSGRPAHRLRFCISDPEPGTQNYFFLASFSLDTLIQRASSATLLSRDPALLFEGTLGQRDSTGEAFFLPCWFFDDALFDGGSYTFEAWHRVEDAEFERQGTKLVTELGHCDEAFFSYFRSLPNLSSDSPTSEPRDAFSNLTSGTGIFAAYSPVRTLKDWP